MPGNDTSGRRDFNKFAQVRISLPPITCWPSALCPFYFISVFMHCCALQAASARSAAVLKPSEAYSGRFINPSLLLLLGAWQRQLWRDTATNRPSKYGGLQSRGNAWSNFGPLHQTASIKGMRQRRGWTVDDTLCWSICVLSVCSRVWVCACSHLCVYPQEKWNPRRLWD